MSVRAATPGYRVAPFARAPYRVEAYDGFSIILDGNDINVVSSTDKPGATWWPHDAAAAIAAELNAGRHEILR